MHDPASARDPEVSTSSKSSAAQQPDHVRPAESPAGLAQDGGQAPEPPVESLPERTALPGPPDPGWAQVYQHMMYGLSLPERALRGSSAVLGGALSESACLLLPQAFRSSKSYDVFVQQMLDFMIKDMGGIRDPSPSANQQEKPEIEAYMARKTVGSVLDMVGFATLHVSPLTVLAVVSDVAYGSQAYLKELSAELKRAGVIDEGTTIDHAGDLLDALGRTSAMTAEAFDTPPLSLAGLQETIRQTQQAASGLDPTRLIPQSEMQQIWAEMHALAQQEGVSLLDVSGALSLFALDRVGTLGHGALSTARVTGNMFERHILDHYRQGLTRMKQEGFMVTFSQLSRPYLSAIWENFASERPTVTEDVLSGRLLGRAWGNVCRWFAK